MLKINPNSTLENIIYKALINIYMHYSYNIAKNLTNYLG